MDREERLRIAKEELAKAPSCVWCCLAPLLLVVLLVVLLMRDRREPRTACDFMEVDRDRDLVVYRMRVGPGTWYVTETPDGTACYRVP